MTSVLIAVQNWQTKQLLSQLRYIPPQVQIESAWPFQNGNRKLTKQCLKRNTFFDYPSWKSVFALLRFLSLFSRHYNVPDYIGSLGSLIIDTRYCRHFYCTLLKLTKLLKSVQPTPATVVLTGSDVSMSVLSVLLSKNASINLWLRLLKASIVFLCFPSEVKCEKCIFDKTGAENANEHTLCQ